MDVVVSSNETLKPSSKVRVEKNKQKQKNENRFLAKHLVLGRIAKILEVGCRAAVCPTR